MSRLCRLKTASHGDDGKWAYGEIVSLRKQRDELLSAQEEIANETAEAIAKMLESGSFLSTESKVALAANGAAKAIRRGAWKEFKK